MKKILLPIFKNLPYVVSKFIFQIYYGFITTKDTFLIWKYLMTNDVDVKKRYFGLTFLDEFYSFMSMQTWTESEYSMCFGLYNTWMDNC